MSLMDSVGPGFSPEREGSVFSESISSEGCEDVKAFLKSLPREENFQNFADLASHPSHPVPDIDLRFRVRTIF